MIQNIGIVLAERERERERDALGGQIAVFDCDSARARCRNLLTNTYRVDYTGLIGPAQRLSLYRQLCVGKGVRISLEICHHATWYEDAHDTGFMGDTQVLRRFAVGSVGAWVCQEEQYQASLVKAAKLKELGVMRVVFHQDFAAQALRWCELQRRH